MIFLYILLPIIGLLIVIYLTIIKPIIRKSQYTSKHEKLYIGMTETEMIAKCGNPCKIIVIDENCKIATYTLDEWKGVLRGGTKHSEITVTIRNGIISNIAT